MQDCGIGFERVRKHTRGLALAEPNGAVASAAPGRRWKDVDHGGSALHGAGGIGGLLAVYDLNDTPGAEQTGDDLQYIYAYDGNGNVVQVLDWSASSATAAIVAKYVYDPYGNVVAQAGDYAERNPFRFSTKQWDDETGFGYWEQRYCSPRLGRWISRDPIEEQGGVNLYSYCSASPVDKIDPRGLFFPTLLPHVVCCRYMGCQKEVYCPLSMSAATCCRCCGKQRADQFLYASLGQCCWCNIYRARYDAPWPLHQSLIIVCPHWAKRIDFRYERMTWGISRGQCVEIRPTQHSNPENDPLWRVQHQARISCRDAEDILKKAGWDALSPPDYNIIQDCHWYARKLFNIAISGGRECR